MKPTITYLMDSSGTILKCFYPMYSDIDLDALQKGTFVSHDGVEVRVVYIRTKKSWFQ